MRGFVYFLLDAESHAVKVGFGKDPRQRQRDCATGNPHKCQLFAAVRGDIQHEYAIHDGLRSRQLVGEWFKWDLITHELMERAAAGAPIDELISFARGELFTRLDEQAVLA